jgi:phage antirepressor YoqD-like protein
MRAFSHDVFGNLEMLINDGKEYVPATDVTKVLGYTKSQTMDVTHSDGSKSVKMNTHWTQKGRLFIHDMLTKRGIIPEMDREAV